MNSATPRVEKRILLVEDHPDTRDLYAVALKGKGFAVDQASSAEVGLRMLAEHRYDLVVVHYNLPRRTGSSMLREARTAGLMGDAASLIVSGDPDVDVSEGSQLLKRPVALDVFLRQVEETLGGGPATSARPEPPPPTTTESGSPPVELVLYVSSDSAVASARARRNVEKILEDYDPAQFRLSICDVAADPTLGEEDRVTFIPTLVKRRPEPRAWVIGNLSNPEVLEDLLLFWGVDPVARRS
jgi:CheY-like chemotaxis protein